MSYQYQAAEKFINEEFYKGTFDNRSRLHLESEIHKKLIADNAAKDVAYFGHRDGVVHASSLYACLRGTLHEMLGTIPDTQEASDEARKLGIFKAGNLFEDFIIEALGDRVVEKQREYTFKYKSITLVGRSDFVINDDGVMRIGENKSVHSDSFWYRDREGTLVAWQNQIQLQIYMWMERELFGHEWDGIFSYISKDDCTVKSAAIKYNPLFISQIVKPALDIINEGYEKKDPNIAPLPDMVIYSESRHQYQKNWLATYCRYHNSCAGAGWILEATNTVMTKNKELKSMMPPVQKKVRQKIEIVGTIPLPSDI